MIAFRIIQLIFSISNRFRDTRGPKSQKRHFQGYIKFSFLIQFLWDFFSLDSYHWEISELLQPIFSISYHFWDTRGPKSQKHHFQGNVQCKLTVSNILLSLNTLLYPTYYCVKHIIVSSKYYKHIYLYSSFVDMLRSYHAALAKPLSLDISKAFDRVWRDGLFFQLWQNGI